MKKLLFLLFLASSIATKSQVILSINNGDINLSTSTYTWSMKPLEYVDVNTTTGLVYVMGGGKQREFYVKSLTSFTVDGVANPITITNVKTTLESNKTLSGGGSSTSDATAALQTAGNTKLTDLNTKAIADKVVQDSLAARLLRIANNNLTYAQLRATALPVTQFISATANTVTNTTTTTTGTVTAGAKIIMVLNNGTANGTFNGAIIKPNESINYPQIANATYPAITYDATGTNFLIVRIN